MGWIQDAIARASKIYRKVDVAVGGILPLGVTREEAKRPQVGKPVITPKEAGAGARGQVVDITKKPSELIPTGVVPKEQAAELKVEKVIEPPPEGRARTDVEAEVKLREQGLMTVQTGVDELGLPVTQVITIQGFKEQSAEAQKAEADLAVDILMRGAAATPGAIMATRAFRGITGKGGKVSIFSKTGGVIDKVQANPKTAIQLDKIYKKFFGAKALAIYGGIGGWIGAVGWGKWGVAEAVEGITFPISKFLIPEAQRTGDWTAVDEALLLAEEITDINIWEKILLWTPLSPFIGIPKKIEGAAAGVAILEQYAEDQKIQQENGETDDAKWERIREEEVAQDKFAVDYYNEERKKMVEWEAEARRQTRNEDAIFWQNERAKQFKMEAEDRQAIADFWTAYRKQSQKIAADNRPSNLNFGLL